MTNASTSLLGDRPVRRIGYGAMQLAGPGVFGPPRDPDLARAVLRRALELGVDHIDTAQFYGPDVVNDLIREALHPYPESLRLVTKVGARRDAKGGWRHALSPGAIREDVESNLRALRVERIDLVNLRVLGETDVTSAGEPPAELLETLADLRREGKLDLIGVSNVTLEGARAAVQALAGHGGLGEVQNAYSVIDRSDDATVDFCTEHDVAYVPFFPLGSAFTGGPQAIADDPAIAAVAERHGATPSQIALAWLLHRSPRILLIPGTGSIEHLEENLAAGDVALTDDDLRDLRDVREIGHPQR